MADYPDLDRASAVLFDVDGTLYDASRLRRRMLFELMVHCLADPRRLPLLRTLQIYRHEREVLADQEAAQIVTLQYQRPAMRLGISARNVEAAITPWIHERPLRHLEGLRVAGVRRFFDRLQRSGRKIGILSDYPAETKLSALGLSADCVVAATDRDVDRLKPHPAGLGLLIRRLQLAPRDCILIGDRESRDGEAARRLSVPFLQRTSRAATPPGLFSDYLELLAEI